VTPVFVVPATVAENCWACPGCRVAVVGEIETEMGAGAGNAVTVALADLDASAVLMAVTTIETLEFTTWGAV